ncbi:MAG: hypothetical protein AB1403_26635, partial [Candidatus Riflebacteria bacterium]
KALNLYKQSLALIDSIPEKFPSTNLATKIAQRQIRLGRYSYESILRKIAGLRARAVKEELLTILQDCAVNLRAPELRVECLANIAVFFVSNGQPEMAIKTLEGLATIVEDISNPASRGHCLNLLAVKFAEIGEFERALTLVGSFSEISDKVRLLTDLGVAFYHKKLREKARGLFNSALELVDYETDSESRIASTAWIALKLAESSEFFWAMEISESVSDSDARIAIVHQIAEKLIESGKFATIQQIIQKIPDSFVRGELMANLVIRYSDDGYHSQAKEFADAIEIPELKARAILAMTRQYKGKKLFQPGLDLIDSAVKMAGKIPSIEEKVSIFTSAAQLSF